MADTIEEGTPVQPSPDEKQYPDGAVGLLMRQLDTLRSQAAANRASATQFTAAADALDKQATDYQTAIDALNA